MDGFNCSQTTSFMIFPSGLLSLGDVHWIFGLPEIFIYSFIYLENIFQFFLEEKQNIFLKHWGICVEIFPFYFQLLLEQENSPPKQKGDWMLDFRVHMGLSSLALIS
jgi:hypothetical protein